MVPVRLRIMSEEVRAPPRGSAGACHTDLELSGCRVDFTGHQTRDYTAREAEFHGGEPTRSTT